MNVIECPFCFGAVIEDSMARHIEWHYPEVEEESPVYGAVDTNNKQIIEL